MRSIPFWSEHSGTGYLFACFEQTVIFPIQSRSKPHTLESRCVIFLIHLSWWVSCKHSISPLLFFTDDLVRLELRVSWAFFAIARAYNHTNPPEGAFGQAKTSRFQRSLSSLYAFDQYLRELDILVRAAFFDHSVAARWFVRRLDCDLPGDNWFALHDNSCAGDWTVQARDYTTYYLASLVGMAIARGEFQLDWYRSWIDTCRIVFPVRRKIP